MANKIILKKSSVGGKVPQSSDLEYGELAINYADGELYYKHSTGTVNTIGGGTGSTITYSNTPPASPSEGDKWVDSNSGAEYTYINDGDTFQWIEVGVSGVVDIAELPTGGNAGEVLAKIDSTDFNYNWVAQSTLDAGSINGVSVEVVSSLPGTPDPNTLYIVTG